MSGRGAFGTGWRKIASSVLQGQRPLFRMKHKRSGGQPSGSTPGVHWADYRKPQGYWAPYNQWWREYVDTTAERPSKAHIEKWYLEHAEVVWPDRDNRPTMAETLAHNKNCRTKASSRDYARQRRERLRLQPGCIANACEDSTTAQSWGQEEGGAQSTNEGSSADELWRCQCGKRQTSSVRFCPALTSPPADFPMDPFAWPGWTSQGTAFVRPKLAGLPCGLYLSPVKAIGETLPANHSGPTGCLWGLTQDDTAIMEVAILPFPLDHPLPSPPPWLTSPQLSGMPHPDTSLAAPCAVSPASPPGVVLQLRDDGMPAMQTETHRGGRSSIPGSSGANTFWGAPYPASGGLFFRSAPPATLQPSLRPSHHARLAMAAAAVGKQ